MIMTRKDKDEDFCSKAVSGKSEFSPNISQSNDPSKAIMTEASGKIIQDSSNMVEIEDS